MQPSFRPFTLNLHGNIVHYNRPVVMGIINVTPDSFYAESRTSASDDIMRRAQSMVDDGVDMFDIGAYSSRPGADDITPEVEKQRLTLGINAIRQVAPHIPISIDTFRADVAQFCINTLGANIINDISGGTLDDRMFETVAQLNVPYILMHMRGDPTTMQQLTDYDSEGGVTAAVLKSLQQSVVRLSHLGVADIIIDPGFGFAKTVEQNYTLLSQLEIFNVLEKPILVGVSRKSMFYKPLHTTPDNVLDATTAANTIALLSGASILRVHDVKAAVMARTVVANTFSL